MNFRIQTQQTIKQFVLMIRLFPLSAWRRWDAWKTPPFARSSAAVQGYGGTGAVRLKF